MGQPQDNIYRSLAQLFLPDELLNYFDVVGFREELTGKEIMNGYPEKILHISLDEKISKPSEDYRPNGFTFTPSINRKNKIALRLWMHFHTPRPERMKGMSFDEIMQDSMVADAINALGTIIKPLLSDKTWYFHGRTYEGNKTYFPSYIDELQFVHQNGWMNSDITNNPQFWIDLDKPSYFEDKQIVATIGDLLIANFDFKKAAMNFK